MVSYWGKKKKKRFYKSKEQFTGETEIQPQTTDVKCRYQQAVQSRTLSLINLPA